AEPTVERATAQYRFVGRYAQQVLLITYLSSGGRIEGGTLNLSELTDDIFTGYAVGYSRGVHGTGGTIASESCTWVKGLRLRAMSDQDLAFASEAILSLFFDNTITESVLGQRQLMLTKADTSLREMVQARVHTLRLARTLEGDGHAGEYLAE
ncbi:MAG: hypothetical protein JO079_13570, partial [Frankiaceae bacterium]|nr:hypothetical protein [Frankiaceae bacterium]